MGVLKSVIKDQPRQQNHTEKTVERIPSSFFAPSEVKTERWEGGGVSKENSKGGEGGLEDEFKHNKMSDGGGWELLRRRNRRGEEGGEGPIVSFSRGERGEEEEKTLLDVKNEIRWFKKSSLRREGKEVAESRAERGEET